MQLIIFCSVHYADALWGQKHIEIQMLDLKNIEFTFLLLMNENSAFVWQVRAKLIQQL